MGVNCYNLFIFIVGAVLAADHDASFCSEKLKSQLAEMASVPTTFPADYADEIESMNLAMIEAGMDKNSCHRGGRSCGTAEGSSSAKVRQQVLYGALAAHPCIETICEIGFNAGHSALNFLMHGQARVVEFDFGEHPVSRPAASYLQKRYPGRLEVHWGSSLDTVPAVAHGSSVGSPPPVCDLLIVDGGHDWRIALADMANMRALANPRWHLVAVDDCMCPKKMCTGPTMAVHSMTKQELFLRNYDNFVGRDYVVIGQYTSKALSRRPVEADETNSFVGTHESELSVPVNTSCPRIDPRTGTFYSFRPGLTTNPEPPDGQTDLCAGIVAAGPKAEVSEKQHLSSDGQVHVSSGVAGLRGTSR